MSKNGNIEGGISTQFWNIMKKDNTSDKAFEELDN